MENKFAKSAYLSFMIWGILSSMGVTFCTLIDATMIGNFVGSDGLAVSSVSNFVFLFLGLIAITLAVGGNVLIGQRLGSNENDKANELFHSLLKCGLIIGLVCSIFTLVFRNQVFTFLGIQESLRDLLASYLIPVFISTPFFILYQILSVSVRTDGDPSLSGKASVILIIINLVLDVVFMGVMKMGMMGASLSMCIGEIVAFFVLCTHFRKDRALLSFRFDKFNRDYFIDFVKNGFGVGSFYIFQAIVVLIFNNLLMSNTDSGIAYTAIYGVIFTVSQIPGGIFDGAGNAFGPVVSIFAGEKDNKSMKYVLRVALRYTCFINLILVAVFFVLGKEILGIFGITNFIGELVFRIFSVSILFTCINTLITSYWQSIGRAKYASLMSFVRNFLLMAVVGYILIRRYYIVGVVLTYVIVEAICTTVILAVYFIKPSYKYIDENYTQSGKVFERYYSIKSESMADISSDLERLFEDWDIDMRKSFTLNFICEEILLNIIKFGLRDSRNDYYIDIKLIENNDNTYTLRIRDNVRDYNPFESDGDEIDNGVLDVIKKKTVRYEYERKLVFNYLYMVV